MKNLLIFFITMLLLLSCGEKKQEKIIHLKYNDLDVIKAYPVVINDKGGDDQVTAMVSHLAESSLKKMERFEYVDRNAWFMMREKPDSIEKLNKIRENMEQVKVLYQGLKIEKAMQLIEMLIKNLSTHFQFFEDLDELYLLKSYYAASNMLGDGLNVDKYFQEIVVLDKSFEMNNTLFAPEILKSFKQAKKKVVEFNTGTIAVSAEPVEAKVYIDGKFAGVTPYFSDNLKVGKHYIKVEADGYVPYGEIITLLPQENPINAPLVPFETNRNAQLLHKTLKQVTDSAKPLFPRSVLKYLQLLPFDQLILFKTKSTGARIYIDLYVFDMPTNSIYLHKNFAINIENSDFENTFFNNVERILSY
ncbi:PEGA domain-containing protein [bacterium]|nr:PEGA domain-containing protein [bacterium]